MGYADLENYCCNVALNRPDLAGAVPAIPVPYDGTVKVLPWFRPALAVAHDQIQNPYYVIGPDGKKELLFFGNWRGMEVTTEGNDPTYGNANFDGIAYPDGYRTMRYVYIVNPITGKVHRRPLRSVSETEYNTQFGESNGWGWCGFFGWGWDEWCNYGCEQGQVRWLDKNGKFFLTHTPGPTATPLTLRMVYDGMLPAPNDAAYTNNIDDWFTINLFQELAKLVCSIIWKNAGEDGNADATRKEAEMLLGNAWKLNQAQKAGSNNRVYVPRRRETRGW